MPDEQENQIRPLARQSCPHCEYSLSGLPASVRLCPECGGTLSAAAFALADFRRARASLVGRLMLLASPGIGIFAAFPFMFMRRGLVVPLSIFFAALWIGGAGAIYLSATKERKSAVRAFGLGLPLGIVYFAACFAIALMIVLPMKLFSMLSDG
jgi:hypothetical protein